MHADHPGPPGRGSSLGGSFGTSFMGSKNLVEQRVFAGILFRRFSFADRSTDSPTFGAFGLAGCVFAGADDGSRAQQHGRQYRSPDTIFETHRFHTPPTLFTYSWRTTMPSVFSIASATLVMPAKALSAASCRRLRMPLVRAISRIFASDAPETINSLTSSSARSFHKRPAVPHSPRPPQ